MGKTGGCATGTGPAGRIVPNTTELELMERKGWSLEENEKKKRESNLGSRFLEMSNTNYSKDYNTKCRMMAKKFWFCSLRYC